MAGAAAAFYAHAMTMNDDGIHILKRAELKDRKSLTSLEGMTREPLFQPLTIYSKTSFTREESKFLLCLSHYYLGFLLQELILVLSDILAFLARYLNRT